MTPDQMAGLYATGFRNSRAWTASEFTNLLSLPGTFLIAFASNGFLLGRVILDEAEVITLIVAPKARRKGVGRDLMRDFEKTAIAKSAARAFLEVAADNTPALALYKSAGWRESGRRKAYYKRQNAPACDAILFEKRLT